MEQRRTVLLADTSTEFRILLREAMENRRILGGCSSNR